MNKISKTAALLLFAAALANIAALGAIIWYSTAQASTSALSGTANLRVTVKDAETGAALQNATVCVIETKAYYATGSDGKTETIQVPVLRNQNFDSSLKRDFGDVTLLVYKDGYIDYILFYCTVKEGETRPGPEITLYKRFSESDLSRHVIIEAPDDRWTDELIAKFKK